MCLPICKAPLPEFLTLCEEAVRGIIDKAKPRSGKAVRGGAG